MIRAAFVAGIALAGNTMAIGDDEGSSWLEHKPLTPLHIVSPGAGCLSFDVWVAETPQEFSRGLMFVKSLPPDRGMLFAMQQPREISMWMRNTFISLDILFADQSGNIVALHRNAEPLSLDLIRSGRPVSAVLELPGGTAERTGIREGHRLRHAHFGSAGCAG